jgi:hypothetical protein
MILQNVENFERVEIRGKNVLVPYPTVISNFKFVGRDNLINKTLAAWMTINGSNPLNFRLYGPPGIGGNAIIYELASLLKRISI